MCLIWRAGVKYTMMINITHNSIFVKINFIFFITFIQLGSSFDDIQELASLRHLESEVRGRSQEMARKGSKDLSPPQNEIYFCCITISKWQVPLCK